MTTHLTRRMAADLECQVLMLLSDASAPIGATSLQYSLTKDGLRVGEATVGRLLRRLDERGITRKHGKLGRTLTSAGQTYLQGLLRERDRRASGLEFLSALDTESPGMVLDALVGRRAIERETAALAAIRATKADVMALQRIQADHDRSKVEGGKAVLENREFHLAIARIGGNRVLETALELLLNEFALSEHVVHVREVAGAQFGIEHPRIIDAISVRDPSRAATAMAEHINQIIRDVYRTYDHVFQCEHRELATYLAVT